MPTFHSVQELTAFLEAAVNKSLVQDVAPVVESTLADQIQEDVYDRYHPVMYMRRKGLGSAENIVSQLRSSGELSVMNIASPNKSVFDTPYTDSGGTSFARWVNDGLVPNIFNDKHYVWQEPANFIEHTVDELQSTGAIKKSLKKGLIRQGISVR